MSSASISTRNTSMAIASIWAWLIPHFYIEFSEWRLAILNNNKTSSSEDDEDRSSDGDGESESDCSSPQISNNINDSNIRRHRKRRKKTDRTVKMSSGSCDDNDIEKNGRAFDWDVAEDADHNNDSIQDIIDENIDPNDIIVKEHDSDDHALSHLHNDEEQQDQQSPRPTSSSPTTSTATTQMQAAIFGSGSAVLIIIVVYAVSALAVGMSTRNMDRKADAIVVGLGRILSAFLFAVFSVTLPMWLGVTYSSNKHTYHKQQISHCTTHREVAFRVAWSFLGHFFVMYGIMLLYFCNPEPVTIPISTGIGISFGFGVVWLVWLGQTKYKRHRRLISFLGSSSIAIASSAAFAAGCWYVKEVWYEGQDVGYHDDWTWFVFFGWLSLCLFANYVSYRLTRRKLAAAVAAATTKISDGGGILDSNSTTNETAVNQSSPVPQQREDDAKRTWRYQAKIFEPPESFCGAATELSKATTKAAVSSIMALQPNFDNISVVSGGKRNRNRANTGGSMGTQSPGIRDPSDLNSYRTPDRRRRSVSSEQSPSLTRSTDVTTGKITATKPLKSPSSGEVVVVGNRDRAVSNVSSLGHDGDGEDLLGVLSPSWETNDSGRRRSFQSTALRRLNESQPDLDGKDQEFGDVDAANEPSLWFMIKTNSCCGRRKYYEAPPRKPWECATNFSKWFLWSVTSAFHIYLTIVTIGATTQQNSVRAALPSTYAYLYPGNYVTGRMCAWNESSPDGDIQTFDTFEDVLASNYSVIHCGACNKCSNWNDLELQWTTRTHLAEDAQECVKKSLGLSNGAADVQRCNVEEIGFTSDCALCWTEDQMCAKKNCFWIFLQSLVVNQVSNFNVGPSDITTATCDEAICGPAFVPCSGATRRRMNIISDIPRPAEQQCTVAQTNWTTVFDFP